MKLTAWWIVNERKSLFIILLIRTVVDRVLFLCRAGLNRIICCNNVSRVFVRSTKTHKLRGNRTACHLFLLHWQSLTWNNILSVINSQYNRRNWHRTRLHACSLCSWLAVFLLRLILNCLPAMPKCLPEFRAVRQKGRRCFCS